MCSQEFVEARRTAGLNNAPACLWSSSPPNELKDAPEQALSANAGFVLFGNDESFEGFIYLSNVYLIFYWLFNTGSYLPAPCRRKETGQNCLEFINIPCICELSC